MSFDYDSDNKIIYFKINNDINSHINSDIYYVNQNGQMNTPNDSSLSKRDVVFQKKIYRWLSGAKK